MPSTFFGLNIAYSGLTASNAGLNTTANNISNAETEGYSRQTVNQEAYDALRTFTTYGCAGAGVDVIAIERMRNEFYDQKYWTNASVLGENDKKQYYMEVIENYFKDDPEKSPGFTTIFNTLHDALNEIIKNSGSTETKEQFVGTAQNLTDYFNTVAGNLQKIQADANSEIKVQVDSINAMAAEIAALNQQINTIELTGTTANELRDKRELLVDKLSKVVDVDVKETPIYDSQFPDRITGANRYVVTIAGGQTLVDMNDYNELECVGRTSTEKINQSDIDGLYDIQWKETGSEFNLYNKSMGGSLRGLIDIRDGNNNTNFQGKVSNVGKDATGNTTVKVDVTADFLQNLNKCTLPGQGTITLANTEFQYSGWSFTCDTTDPDNPKYSYTFTMDSAENTQLPGQSFLNKEAEVGEAIGYKGVPYYMEQMNEWVRCYAQAANKILTQDGVVDAEGNQAGILYTAKDHNSASGQASLGVSYDPEDVDGSGKKPTYTTYKNTIYSTDDSYYKMTALNFTVSDSMIRNADNLGTHTGASEGQDKYDVIEDLIKLKSNKSAMSFRGGSSSNFLESIQSDIALSASKANTGYINSTNMSNTIANQRLSISGVDKDEEALSLVKYQNSFTLASKMISVLTEVYDQLILNTGV
ncbi:MAG: flagellar hook-associated protein FlgK [Lachnospiraceae bacterium]|nr:flagellar hook-associated protein FlgK [Lachnospiraceae bacterium]